MKKVALPKIPDYSTLSPVEVAAIRAEFRVRYGLIKKEHPEITIPAIAEDAPLENLYVEFSRFVRHIRIANSNKTKGIKLALIACHCVIEVVLTKGLKWRQAEGYARKEIARMNKYETLIIQLGARDIESAESTPWSLELQIIWMAGLNAAIFIGLKLLSTLVGIDISDGMLDGAFGILDESGVTAVMEKKAESKESGAAPSTAIPVVPSGGFDWSSIGSLAGPMMVKMINGMGAGPGDGGSNPMAMLGTFAKMFTGGAASPAAARPGGRPRPVYRPMKL